MQYRKGEGDQDSVCVEQGSKCPESPVGAGRSSPCHDPGSLSRDIEGSCQSEPRGCPPGEPAGPAWSCCPAPRSCCPAPQSCCSSSKPRRRVELRPEQPLCPPERIRRRPLQQYRPRLHPGEPGCCDAGRPRRRVEQRPEPPACPPLKMPPRAPQRCCLPRRPAAPPCPCQRRQPAALPPCLLQK